MRIVSPEVNWRDRHAGLIIVGALCSVGAAICASIVFGSAARPLPCIPHEFPFEPESQARPTVLCRTAEACRQIYSDNVKNKSDIFVAVFDELGKSCNIDLTDLRLGYKNHLGYIYITPFFKNRMSESAVQCVIKYAHDHNITAIIYPDGSKYCSGAGAQ